MKAELDIFSGRPNPAWELTDAEVTELSRRLSALPLIDAPALPQALGYRGLVILNTDRRAGLPARMRVHRGIVAIEEGGSTNYYRDANSIEPWFLRQARAHGYGPIIDQVVK